jgi:hypothetical protein
MLSPARCEAPPYNASSLYVSSSSAIAIYRHMLMQLMFYMLLAASISPGNIQNFYKLF